MAWKSTKYSFPAPRILILLAVLGCGQMTREDLLGGNFGTVDKTPPKLIAPTDNSRVIPNEQGQLAVTLVWEDRRDASYYQVDIALDAEFAQPVAGSPIFVRGIAGARPDNTLNWLAPDARSYYWRVGTGREDVAANRPRRRIHFMRDAVFVYCPDSEADCNNQGMVGNKTAPFRSVSEAIYDAAALGLEVRVAARGGSAAYDESVRVLPGVNVLGGYEAQNWTRDIEANETIIASTQHKTIVLSQANSSTEFRLEGFTIRNLHPQANATKVAVHLDEVSKNFLIRKNRIFVTNGLHSYGVLVERSHVTLTENTIEGGEANGAPVVIGSSASAILNQNTLISGNTSQTTTGIILRSNASSIILNSTISGNSSTLNSQAISIDSGATTVMFGNVFKAGNAVHANARSTAIRSTGGQFVVMNNYLVCSQPTGASSQSYGIETSWPASNAFIANNTICVGHGVTAHGISGFGALTTRVDNNLIFMLGTGNRFAVYESNATNDPLSLRNNNLFDAGTGGSFYFYRDADATGLCHSGGSSSAGNCATIADMEGDINAEFAPARAAGNGSFGPLADTFVNAYGIDGDPYTHADNNWSLRTSATGVTGGGLSCPGGMSSQTFNWGTGTNQANCDQLFPFARSTYVSGNCRSVFLYPAVEIDPQTKLVTGNGLCEAGESCLYNPNKGAYAGHGDLIAAGCDLSGVAGGTFATVSLYRYGSNGF